MNEYIKNRVINIAKLIFTADEYETFYDNVDHICKIIIDNLNPRELEIFSGRENKKTYETLGKELEITRERVRQIEKKAETKIKLRLKNYVNKIKSEKELAKKYVLTEQNLIKELKERIPKLKYLIEYIDKLESIITCPDSVNLDKYKADLPLDSLGLSVRAYNCLKRFFDGYGIILDGRWCYGADYYYLGEPIDIANITAEHLAAISESELSMVRNLGKKCVLEIKNKLNELGYSLRPENLPRPYEFKRRSEEK